MKRFVSFLIIPLVTTGALWYYKDRIAEVLYKLPTVEEVQKIVRADLNFQDIEKKILTPPPLRAKEGEKQPSTPTTVLTKDGVIKWTNTQRTQNSLAALKENTTLNSAATQKLNDMFKNQYFEHVSPAGLGVDHWVGVVTYHYLTVGENLALGNFANDEALVRAWMNSPGHRANILNGKFREIGVAVGKGMFEGKIVWLGVQIFGTPLSACPQPSQSLKMTIATNKEQVQIVQNTLERLKAELEAEKNKNEYNQKVKEYNAVVREYNALVEQTKALVAEYNIQINMFNTCVSG